MTITVHIYGKPTILTNETLKATRDWYAELCRACAREALAYVQTKGAEGFFTNDTEDYIERQEHEAAEWEAGKQSTSLAFIQRALFIQTGESVPLLT